MRSSRPWRMFGPLALVLLLFGGWSVFWLFASTAARATFATERHRLEAQGFRLDCAKETWGGYPFRFEFTCAAPRFSTPRATVTAQHLEAVVQAYNPRHAIVLIDGPAMVEGSSRSLALQHGRALISFIVEGRKLSRFSAEIPTLVAKDLGSAARVLLHGRATKEGLWEFALAAEGAELALPGQPRLEIDAADARLSGGSDSSLDIASVSLSQGKVKLWGKGGMGLDEQNRPAGKIELTTNDLDGLLKVAAPFFLMTGKDRAALRLFLSLFGKEIRADMIFQDGEFYWGPVRLGELTPLF